MEVTEAGIIRFVKPIQLEKVPSAIVFISEGMFICVKPSQSLKAYAPMEVTVEGIFISVKAVQFSKASSPIAVMEAGMLTAVKAALDEGDESLITDNTFALVLDTATDIFPPPGISSWVLKALAGNVLAG